MSGAHGTTDLEPESTEGFKVGESKVREIPAYGRRPLATANNSFKDDRRIPETRQVQS